MFLQLNLDKEFKIQDKREDGNPRISFVTVKIVILRVMLIE